MSQSKCWYIPNDGNISLQDQKYLNKTPNQMYIHVTASSNFPKKQQLPEILKLNIDCCEETFDYLPLIDLVSVGKTCKRLQQVAGYYFQQYYLGSAMCNSCGIRSYHGIVPLDVEHFAPYIQKIVIYRHWLQHFLNTQSQFRRLNQITIVEFGKIEMKRLKEIQMSECEVLCVVDCDLNNNFHEITDQCAKLKRLEISSCCGEFNWFDRKYSTLKYLKLASCDGHFIDGVPMFLELNPNIQKFATTSTFIWENRHKILLANVKLNNLSIRMDYETRDKVGPMCDLLNTLYERGFYRKLEVYFFQILDQQEINQLAVLRGLVKLYFESCRGSVVLSPLKELEELHIGNKTPYIDHYGWITDFEVLANELSNLRRIHFVCVGIDDILPFIKRSVNMQRIKVDKIRTKIPFNNYNRVIDLFALNQEREKIMDAHKITLFVEEDIYLGTKWLMGETDMKLIRLKRKESFEWEHDFF